MEKCMVRDFYEINFNYLIIILKKCSWKFNVFSNYKQQILLTLK